MKPFGRPVKPDSLRQRAIALGLNPEAVQQRVRKLGWPVEKALAVPVRRFKASHAPQA